MQRKWNWRAGLGWVLVILALTRTGEVFSLTTHSSPGAWGDATGIIIEFFAGFYFITRLSCYVTAGGND